MIRRGLLVFTLASVAGCNLDGFEESNRLSPDEIDALIDKAPYPDYTPSSSAVQPSRISMKEDGTRTIEIDLNEALRLILLNNQAWLGQSESLDLQLLSLQVLRRSWWPMQSPLVGTLAWGDTKDTDPASSQSLSASVSQKLPWGGTASISASESGAQGIGPNIYGANVTAGVNIPLFRGAGWRATVESQVSAERNYVYQRRNYEYARTDLLIQTVQSYFGQIQQQRTIKNLERTLESARKGAERSQLMFDAGKVTRSSVFREELNAANAENALTDARENRKLSLDAFKIDLGLRPEDDLVLEEEDISYTPLELDPKEAVEGAFASNPQWLNARDAFDDAGRALEIAHNATLPQVDVGANYTWAQLGSDRPFEDFETGTRGVGLTASFAIDLERSALNQTYQAAIIAYRQAERSFRRSRDEITRETQRLLIQLRQAELSMAIQDRAQKDAEKALELAQDEYERGLKDNINVTDARNQRVLSQNQFEAQRVTAKVTQLQLLQWIGRLRPDDEGRWFR
jgi:outer membrane protein TolC